MLKQVFAATTLLTAALGVHADVINIDNAELTRLMSSGVAVVDIRTAPEWKETGVVPGSHLFTLFDERGKADAPTWLEKVKSVAKPDQPVVVICRTGNRTKAASQFLSQQAGYKTVYNVTKGIQSWARDGGRVVPATASVASCAPGARC